MSRERDRPEADERRGSRILDSSLRNEALPEHARCPFCGGRDSEQFSAFGSAVSTSQYYCRRCRTVFEFMKPRGADRDPPEGTRAPGRPGRSE